MRFLKEPARFLVVWAVICAIPVVLAIGKATEPVSADCFEYCDIGWAIFGLVFFVMTLVWLAGAALVLWLWQRSN